MMGPYIDIPGPEISAGSRMMSWFFDEYSKYKRFSPACVTGKVCSQATDLNMAVHESCLRVYKCCMVYALSCGSVRDTTSTRRSDQPVSLDHPPVQTHGHAYVKAEQEQLVMSHEVDIIIM